MASQFYILSGGSDITIDGDYLFDNSKALVGIIDINTGEYGLYDLAGSGDDDSVKLTVSVSSNCCLFVVGNYNTLSESDINYDFGSSFFLEDTYVDYDEVFDKLNSVYSPRFDGQLDTLSDYGAITTAIRLYVSGNNYDFLTINDMNLVTAETPEPPTPEPPTPEPPSPEPSDDRRKFYTVYLPTDENMDTINDAIFLTSGGTANVLQYFSSYKKFFVNIKADGTKTLKASKYDFGVDSPYTDKSIVEYSCGTVEITEEFQSLLDYSPFSRLTIYMPFIGFMDLDVVKVMGKTLELKYKVDVLSGRCLAEIWSTCVEPSVCIASYAGTIASDEIFGSDGGNSYWGTYELMTSMQLGELSAYIVVSTKEALESGIADYEGLPCKEVVKVGDVVGFVRYDSIWASGMTATEAEKKEIESLLKSGVLVD